MVSFPNTYFWKVTGVCLTGNLKPIEFSLNVFTEFAEFNDKNICHYSKRLWTCYSATSCVRVQDATTAPAIHMWETGSLNWAQFMLQWFIRFPEFSGLPFHLGKTPLSIVSSGSLWKSQFRFPEYILIFGYKEQISLISRSEYETSFITVHHS